MTLKVKKIICLALVACMVMTCFSACGSNSGGTSVSLKTELEEMDTETEMTIEFMFWEDEVLFTGLNEYWAEMYPNITVALSATSTSDIAQTIADRAAASNTPDVFWYVSEIDTPISAGYWQDMTGYFVNDPENDEILLGIQEYKNGYFGTDYKFATPIKWFPDVAWLNKQFFEDNSMSMPSTDWTWEEMETVIEEATMSGASGRYGNKQSFGLTCAGGCYPVTWYPLAANDDCIGEFGWDGSEYHMDDWATALNKQASYLKNGWLVDDDTTNNTVYQLNTVDAMESIYGEQVFTQDAGYNAVRFDVWWCWGKYWHNSEQGFETNNVIWVPYIQPHLSTTEGKTNIGTFDMGGIGLYTDHAREAYEVLKYFCWSAQGWIDKINVYTTYESDTLTNTQLRDLQIDCPITLNDEAWEAFMAFEYYPQEDDEYGRYQYFQDCWAQMRTKYWTGLGSTTIPGFSTWLADVYQLNGYEAEILYNGQDATQYESYLEETGKEYYEERHDEILEIIDFLYAE